MPAARPAAHDASTGVVHRGLSQLVADLDLLAAEHWGRSPLLTRGEDLPSPATLFGSDAVDELLGCRGLRTPFVKLVKDGRPVAESAYTVSGGVGATVAGQVSDDRVLALFAGGATIVLQGLHRTWGPVVDLAQAVSADLGHPVQVNAYITPPDNRGFDPHYDVHDVFVLQIQGEKHWEVREPVLLNPLRSQPSAEHQAAVQAAARSAPFLDAVLRPGDCLYLPRGWLHSATALGGTSIHLTIGVHVWTVHHLLEQAATLALRALDEDPQARASLPIGFDLTDQGAIGAVLARWSDRLGSAARSVEAGELTDELSTAARRAMRAAPIDVLGQFERSQAASGERWVVRPHLHPASVEGALASRSGTVQVDEADRPTVAALLNGADAGMLRPDLVRRLALAGVLVPERSHRR